jgi:hypothetical protein
MRPEAWLAVVTLAALCLPRPARAQTAQDPTAASRPAASRPAPVMHLGDVPRQDPAREDPRARAEAAAEANEEAADRWEPGQPVPPGYRIEHPVQLGFIIPGAATFSVLYLVSAALSDDGDSPVMAVPLVGPLFALNQDHPRTKYGTPALLVLGLGQVVGVGMVALGFVHRRTTLDEIDEDDVEEGLASRLSVGPLWTEKTQGLAVAGRF